MRAKERSGWWDWEPTPKLRRTPDGALEQEWKRCGWWMYPGIFFDEQLPTGVEDSEWRVV
jgi:hypothetical protein